MIFKHVEPRHSGVLLLLLLGVPCALAVALRSSFPSPASALLTCTALHLASLATSVAIYRLSPLHPLADYPGPTLCKLSRLPVLYVTYTGRSTRYFRDLHAQYGVFVRIGNPATSSPADPLTPPLQARTTCTSPTATRYTPSLPPRPSPKAKVSLSPTALLTAAA